jgi:hypothetical protein
MTKRRIALIQMERSLECLEAGDPVSALTLAGAAEEILGRFAAAEGRRPAVEHLADALGSLYDWIDKPRPQKKKLIALENTPRNEIKHQNDGRNVTVQEDFVFEAERMLLRCMFNHFNAFRRYPKSKKLCRWLHSMRLRHGWASALRSGS